MDLNGFKRVLSSFTDDHADLDLDRGELVVQIRGELIVATVNESEGDVFITEHGAKERAFNWLVNRVAKLPQLAARIISHVVPEPHFITPAGKVLDHIEDESGDERTVGDVPSEVTRLLDSGPSGTSTVLYVTSDAGEGKTTVIDQIAITQAQKYKSGQAKWLLLPIRLGGRSFLTFDDVVVAELVNRFRFQFFYYDAFLELVRLGVVVPAFDGFEEIFVEGSTGEAVSSLGNLVRSLDSSGAIVIAVRKAHFEYHSFQDQARIFDAVSDVDASFARVSLERWDKGRFLKYCKHRGLSSGEEVYKEVRDRLQADDHPVLTRAVLAKRLVDVVEEEDLGVLLDQLGTSVSDYFYHFVNAIVRREVQEKWIDRSGVPHQALLTVEEHHELLRMIAKEMWITSSDALGVDYLDLIAELFAEEFAKTAIVARQVTNRIGQHSLIAVNRTTPMSYSFDHDDFRRFYLGEAVAKMIVETDDLEELRIFLGKRALPEDASDSAAAAMRRMEIEQASVSVQAESVDLGSILGVLGRIALGDSGASYVGENVGGLAIRLLDILPNAQGTELRGFHFPTDAIRGKEITGATFSDCSFERTSFDTARLAKLHFANCQFDEIQLTGSRPVVDVEFHDCEISCVRRGEEGAYEPRRILQLLKAAGFTVGTDYGREEPEIEEDELTDLAGRALRTFLRATAVNEGTLNRRLGVMSGRFFDEVLPPMLERGILKEVEFAGRGRRQRRFKVAVSMQGIESASKARGQSLCEFIDSLAKG